MAMTASVPSLTIQTFLGQLDTFSDSRTHGYQGPSRHVRLPRVTPSGGGAIAKSEDGLRCAVAGKESLRIVRVSDPAHSHSPEHKSAVGRGGHRIDVSRNFWDNNGLKIDSASTDIAWGCGPFNNKILTSARNGELIMWDLNRSGVTKYERRTKDHIRSINKLSVSKIVHHYCITGSADGDMRVWDLRDLSKSLMRVKHPTSVRSVVFSPSVWQPLQAAVGLDNGSIHRWDLRMGQRGQLDRLAVAHSASITTMDWCSAPASHLGIAAAGSGPMDTTGNGLGWLVSGGLDRCVKVWDLTGATATTHIPNKPAYTLHPSFAVRRVVWRPGYECELGIVSNAEFPTQTFDVPHSAPPNTTSGLLTRVGSGLGLDVMMKGFTNEGLQGGRDKHTSLTNAEAQKVGSAAVGDAIEIWDVRRGFIAKWSLTGSASEGGVTDIVFNDSHAIWAQQSTGTFSQYDLREATKPLSAIPRLAATWEATGSMTFVADRKHRWEVPYDDIRKPEHSTGSEGRISTSKALGDLPVQPKTQTIGTYVSRSAIEDVETFTTLARGYLFEGGTRKELCDANAHVAFQSGQEHASQTWLLMSASLSNYIPSFPPTPPQSPRLKARKTLPSVAPQCTPTTANSYTFPPISNLTSERTQSTPQKTSPAQISVRTNNPTSKFSSRSRSASASRRITPTSSTSSSPHHLPTGLPSPLTPNRTAFFTRRESVDSGVHRHPSSLRRPSLSTTGHSSSPIDRGAPSLRHVGEGALDDSDSDSGGEEDTGDDTAGEGASDEESSLRPLISPIATLNRQLPTPSPLSRVVGQQHWTEDEDEHDKDPDDEASPSPRSTDTESDESSSSRRQAKSRSSKRNSGRIKSRSRSSTVASLAAPLRTLLHQDSRSSIRTVTAAETSFKEHDDSLQPEETLQDLMNGHRRQRSQPISEFVQDAEPEKDKGDRQSHVYDETKTSQRRIEIIQAEENRIREITWAVLRDAFEDFAEEGNVQMCAMLSILAREELKVPRKRMLRFLDAYIECLMRLRLYTCAAYMRKYSEIKEIRDTSLLETIIYTSCGRCRKPLLKPAITSMSGEHPSGVYSYCLGCKSNCVTCAICRLPVRALLFQCSVCNHGGHQDCYRRYYMEQPMVDLPGSFLPSSHENRGRLQNPHPILTSEDDASSMISAYSSVVGTSTGQSPVITDRSNTQKLMGHPCAAGCGHFCWAANGTIETSEI